MKLWPCPLLADETHVYDYLSIHWHYAFVPGETLWHPKPSLCGTRPNATHYINSWWCAICHEICIRSLQAMFLCSVPLWKNYSYGCLWVQESGLCVLNIYLTAWNIEGSSQNLLFMCFYSPPIQTLYVYLDAIYIEILVVCSNFKLIHDYSILYLWCSSCSKNSHFHITSSWFLLRKSFQGYWYPTDLCISWAITRSKPRNLSPARIM